MHGARLVTEHVIAQRKEVLVAPTPARELGIRLLQRRQCRPANLHGPRDHGHYAAFCPRGNPPHDRPRVSVHDRVGSDRPLAAHRGVDGQTKRDLTARSRTGQWRGRSRCGRRSLDDPEPTPAPREVQFHPHGCLLPAHDSQRRLIQGHPHPRCRSREQNDENDESDSGGAQRGELRPAGEPAPHRQTGSADEKACGAQSHRCWSVGGAGTDAIASATASATVPPDASNDGDIRMRWASTGSARVWTSPGTT